MTSAALDDIIFDRHGYELAMWRFAELQSASHPTFGDISSWQAWKKKRAREVVAGWGPPVSALREYFFNNETLARTYSGVVLQDVS